MGRSKYPERIIAVEVARLYSELFRLRNDETEETIDSVQHLLVVMATSLEIHQVLTLEDLERNFTVWKSTK